MRRDAVALRWGQCLGASSSPLQASEATERGGVRILSARQNGRGADDCGSPLGRCVAPRAVGVRTGLFNQLALPLGGAEASEINIRCMCAIRDGFKHPITVRQRAALASATN